MENIFNVLKERGFIKQVVYEEELIKLLGSESVTFYIGFDPTADSLHIGSFVMLMAMAHMQRAGHRPLAVVGGGTGMIGDPSGRSDLREMLNTESIEHNCLCLKKQISKFIEFGDDKALMINNADWLTKLNYLDFIRDIGVHFSVNKMLTAECFKTRMEKGLSFLEFNYMLMQAYDFLVLNNKYNCKLQLGGDDQWSNILAGADLIRRKEARTAYAMTFTLLVTCEGTKMGKSAKGTVWLDANKTTPYDFYQYLRNIADEDVENCLKLLTFVPLDEISRLVEHKDERMNKAKSVLAYEVTKIVHSLEIANTVKAQVEASFSNDIDNMPTITVTDCKNIIELLIAAKLVKSNGEAKRLIEQGAIYINDTKIEDFNTLIQSITTDKELVLHKGKKTHIKVILG